ncbi:bifunctional DNA-formamidopyrimidine glycosylase/DNA-(apurinic or apyrimidinic site) lyase [Candidatus Liberibacter solanacearum]|uniref:Formamidopyrimidine-DNA glycosylase n=1 Tax=Candidatus Liberibacter solanacearum TaxID=556287 RepID=A0A3R7RJQ1_9HYPH|nr:bifunctional DNA-formamidopyrimidine glycosylase/DNA-(apurinic or apyrimidinic site) lyase [Candidatus Liberibacter solanacearum]RPD37791.1 bifunctional DNA-formamidopyrimidine glycosylase/DNA-(apurinic or apyrimidinic site) lyase [Candidatus Liberibacter solanacearum]
MPELPEVEIIRRNLIPVMKNMILTDIWLHRKNLRFDFPPNFALNVRYKKITNVIRRAKYLLIELEDNLSIIAHLGMSGSFIIEDTSSTNSHKKKIKNPRHNHVTIFLSNEDKTQKYRVIYNDPRRFGFMDLVKTSLRDQYPSLIKIGPEPTDSAFNATYLTHQFYKRNSNLKNALLNQKIVAGLGNIYVCEALWRARISPVRTAKSLVQDNKTPNEKISRLIQEIQKVLTDAINAGGSSLRDYVHTDGSIGSFQNSFAVYGKTGKSCPSNCGQMIRRIVQSGRSTFYCTYCQK